MVMATMSHINAKIERKYSREEGKDVFVLYILSDEPTLKPLHNTFLGHTYRDAVNTIRLLNKRQNELFLSRIILED